MSITVTSNKTFNIPQDIRDIQGGSTARIKRISADGVIPVVLEGTANLNIHDDIKNGRYICLQEGATLDTIISKRIESVNLKPNIATGIVEIDPSNKSIVIGTGTTFTTELYETTYIEIDGHKKYIKTIIDDTHLEIYNKFTEDIYDEQQLTYFTVEITLQNPRGEHWDTFPTTDTLCLWTIKDNTRYLSDFKIELYYMIQSKTANQIVFDISYTPNGAVDMKLERASYQHDLTQENFRTHDIFNDDSYIYEAKDTSGTYTKNIYTWTNTGAGSKVSLRSELGVTLEDQLIKMVIYPDGMADDSIINVDVKENTLGKRFTANFSRV